jgi:hypothetical protein
VATTIAKPKALKAKGTNTKETLSLVVVALSTAKAVEYMANGKCGEPALTHSSSVQWW